MSKPKGDLSALVIPKGLEQPENRTTAAPASVQGKVKSLTVKLTEDEYWQLRDATALASRRLGKRMTHQDYIRDAILTEISKELPKEKS